MPTTRGGWADKHTEQKVCEPHYKWDFGRVWGARWEPLETQGENGIDTGGGSVYTYRIRRAWGAARNLETEHERMDTENGFLDT
jgi:hypothetical protein